MTGRPGFLGGLQQGDAPERDVDSGFGSDSLIGGSPVVRLGGPNAQRSEDGVGTPSGFDPVWGTLGAAPQNGENWRTGGQEEPEGLAVDVEIFGSGFQVSGQIHTGQFERLSDWINMQTGFIAVRDAWHVLLGQTHAPDRDRHKGTLWVRLDQVVLVAERSPVQANRSGAPIVQKQKRSVSLVTPGYNLLGAVYVHAYGSMSQFLESPDPHFLPMTDVTVRWLSETAMVSRFPFAMVNREQLITVLDESATAASESAQTAAEREDAMPLHRRFGAA